MQRFDYSKDRETINSARARALESLLIEKGVITHDTVDKIMNIFATEMGPFNGAKLVARAWLDPKFKKLLADDTMAAVEQMGFVTKRAGAEGEHMKAAINTPKFITLSSVRSAPVILGLSWACHPIGTRILRSGHALRASPERC
jgi:nitrile hydratase subunit alpha